MMYRYLFRQRRTPLSPACFLSLSQYGNGGGRFSTVARSSVTRGNLGLTFCHWRYWKQMAGTLNKCVPCVSNRWNRGAANYGQSKCSESVTDVFERYQALLDGDSFHTKQVVQFTTALRSAVYSSLGWLPWLHTDNHIIAFMQILMNGKVVELLRNPLYDEEHFGDILRHLEMLVDELPREDCPSVLLSLLYSGLDRTEPIVGALLARCQDSAPVLNIQQLRDLTHILQSLGGRDFTLAERIVSRLDHLVSRDTRNLAFEVRDLCVFSPVLAVFMSRRLLDKTSRALLGKLQQQGPDLDVFTMGSCFRYARKMKFRVNLETLEQIKSLAKASLDRLEDCGHLQSYHIAEICHNAKHLACFTGDIVDKVQARSLQLLRESEGELQIRDITNLLFAFSKTAAPTFKQEASQLLVEHLDSADVLTLSNIADNILDLGLDDPNLITFFQYKVMQNIDNISRYITRLVKILRLLRERHNCDRKFNHQLCSVLLKILDRHQGYDPTLTVVVAQFVLPNVRTVIPAVLMELLLYALPRCNLSFMLMTLTSLDKVGSPRSRSLHNQILELRSCIQQNIGHQIHNATRAAQLADLVKGLHIKSKSRDSVLLDQLMDHYPTLTPTMGRPDYLRTLFVFRRLPNPYYHPQVFEDLITFTRNNYSQLKFSAVLDLVAILANAGYRPENFDDFSAFTTGVLEEVMEREDPLTQVTLTHNLSLLGIFPDPVLSHIFTFDYLEKVDSSIEEEEGGGDLVRNLMMQLNRSVILECPHLDVPWFHQHYCQDRVQTSASKDFRKNMVMVEEVEVALQEVMSGHHCVASRVYSPYFHPIDFEIVLDGSGQPVPTAAVQLIRPEELGYDRVALMLLGNQQLCTNGLRRRGQYLRDRHHLEILGYRVEEISQHDWHSMALREWGARVDFIRNKIFPDDNNNNNKLRGAHSEATSQCS